MKLTEKEIESIDNEILSSGKDMPHKDYLEIKENKIKEAKN